MRCESVWSRITGTREFGLSSCSDQRLGTALVAGRDLAREFVLLASQSQRILFFSFRLSISYQAHLLGLSTQSLSSDEPRDSGPYKLEGQDFKLHHGAASPVYASK